MTVAKPHLPPRSEFGIQAWRLLCHQLQKGTAVKFWTHGYPRPLPRAGEQLCCSFWAVGCWPSVNWHRHFAVQVFLGSLQAQDPRWEFLEQKQGAEECMEPAYLYLHWLLWSLHSVRLNKSMGRSPLPSQHFPLQNQPIPTFQSLRIHLWNFKSLT